MDRRRGNTGAKTRGPTGRTRPRLGFTLFEVAISMFFVAVGVISVVLLMMQGVKSQQLARYQLFASAVALEIIDAYNQIPTNYWGIRAEGQTLVDVPFNRCTTAPDLDKTCVTYAGNIFPVPLEIARRLDSEDDEIRRILDQGGVLFYFGPKPGAGSEFDTFSVNGGQLQVGQRVLFAVDGFAQQNALLYHPMIAWPYYMGYPGPPEIDGWRGQGFVTGRYNDISHGNSQYDIWEGQIFIGTAHEAQYRIVRSSAYAAAGGQSLTSNNVNYYNQAKTLWSNVFAADGVVYSPTVETATDGRTPPTASWSMLTDAGALGFAQRVIAWKYLAHATNNYFANNGTDFFNRNPLTATGMNQAIEMRLNHEASLRWVMKWQAERPYDVRVYRPHNRQLFLDFPLFQYDLFTAYDDQGAGGFYPGIGGQPWRSWKVVHAPSFTMPTLRSQQGLIGQFDPQADWLGDTANFNLTAPFIAAERCRQLVFWAVDWQSYEDFEEAPSVPMDSSRLITFPKRSGTGVLDYEWNAADTDAYNSSNRFRNPELAIVFKESNHAVDVPGSGVSGDSPGTRYDGVDDPAILGDDRHPYVKANAFNSGRILRWPGSANITEVTKAELGLFGADRNGNGQFDRGTVPTSSRMRAQTVGRFNFYDKRLPGALRQ